MCDGGLEPPGRGWSIDLDLNAVAHRVTAPGTTIAVGLAIAFASIVGCTPPTGPDLPSAGPQVVCQGVPDSVCKQAIDTVGVSSRGPVAQFVLRCSKPICTERLGEAEVLMVFVDGRREVSNYGWSSEQAAPIPVITAPALPVEPGCEGVPLTRCIEMAVSGLDGRTVGAVGRITVQCVAVCTPTNGNGQTVYEFVDGRPSITIQFSYGGGG